MEQNYPFDDKNMTYDKENHRYVLTSDYVLRELGINLAGKMDDAEGKRMLARVSRTVYLYLYESAWGQDYLEYILAVYPPLRDTVKQMLTAQLEYGFTNGQVSAFSGMNFAKGTVMDIDAIRGRAKVANEVEQLALQEIPGLGICLKYAGRLPLVPREDFHNGY